MTFSQGDFLFMPTSRLYQQFQRLAQQLGCDEREISLAEVADLLCCTPQCPPAAAPHGRAGLAVLDGRSRAGRRSRLTLLDNQESLTRRRLRDLLSQGQLAQAVRLAEDRLDLLTRCLSSSSARPPGRAPDPEGALLPAPARSAAHRALAPLRNSPEPPALQRSDPAKRGKWGNRGDLAHHWECLAPCHWRFYLRPVVRFHHGRELVVEDVMESLQALRDRPLFAHLARLESRWPRTLDIHLDSPDPLLPHLLAEPVAAILPRELKGRRISPCSRWAPAPIG